MQGPELGAWRKTWSLGDRDRNHRVVCIDEMKFGDDGTIQPVRITFEGVGRDPVART